MDRKRFEQLVPDYIENNLSGRELSEFNAWLKDHPEAREEVGELRELILDVSDIEVPNPENAFWTSFLPDLRTRMELRVEKLGIAERLRRVLLRPAIISSFALATVILALLVLYSNIGPRGDKVMEARQVNHRLEAALRGTEDSTLAQMETYFERQNPAGDPGAPLFAQPSTLAAADSDSGANDWIDSWLDREEEWRAARAGEETYRLLDELESDEVNRLAEMLQAEITAG